MSTPKKVKVARNFNPSQFGEGKYAVNHEGIYGSPSGYKAADTVSLINVSRKSTASLGLYEEGFGCYAVLEGTPDDIPKPASARRLAFHYAGYFTDDASGERLNDLAAVWLDETGMFYATAEEVAELASTAAVGSAAMQELVQA